MSRRTRSREDAWGHWAGRQHSSAVVTENHDDFLGIDAVYRDQDRAHYGLVLTSDRRFHRGSKGAIGQLVLALDAFPREQPAESRPESLVHWLR